MKKEKEEYDMELMGGVLKGCLAAIAFWLALIFLVLMFASCKSVKYVPVIEHRTDTCYITKHQRDSIWLHDSIYMHEYQKGDTVFMLRDRWHTKYIETVRTDTTYIATHDTIPDPYPVEVKVPRELSWWQKALQRTGGIALGLLFLWLGWQAWKIYKRRF